MCSARLANRTKVGGRPFPAGPCTWSLMRAGRRPRAAGARCTAQGVASQSFRSRVFWTLVAQLRWTAATADGISRGSSPRPVSADRATEGRAAHLGQRPLRRSRAVPPAVPAGSPPEVVRTWRCSSTSPRPSRSTRSASCRSWVSKALSASITRMTISAKVMARIGIRGWRASPGPPAPRALRRRPGGVDPERMVRPSQVPVHGDGVAG